MQELADKWPQTLVPFIRNKPPYMSSEDYQHMLDGLRKAGWEG
jgi:hypothetical protein